MNTKYVKGKAMFTNVDKKVEFGYLKEDINTEILIIGGGITGSILAYYLAKNNIKCVVLDKERIGYGSTSISTALLQYELDSMVNVLEEFMSKENIEKAYKLCLKALSDLDDIIQKHGNKCEYIKSDILLYSAKIEDKKILKSEFDFRKSIGLDVEFIDKNQNIFPFDIQAGIISRFGGAKINPYLLSVQLLEIAKQKGSKIYENTKVDSLEYLEDEVIITTNYENKIKCKKVIVATGYDTDSFLDRNLGTKSITYNVVTEKLKNIEDYNKYIIRDTNSPYNYYRKTVDNRIIAGGEDMEVNDKNYSDEVGRVKYGILENRLKTLFPNSRQSNIEYKYEGIFCSTKDDLGFIGPDNKHKNLWYSLGYGANGILYAILAGQMLSELYLGEENEDMKLFKIDRFDK